MLVRGSSGGSGIKLDVSRVNESINELRSSTKTTYETLEQWKNVHKINPNIPIPYPQDCIQSQNWDEVSGVIIETDFGTDLREYISRGTEVKPYEELARGYRK